MKPSGEGLSVSTAVAQQVMSVACKFHGVFSGLTYPTANLLYLYFW